MEKVFFTDFEDYVINRISSSADLSDLTIYIPQSIYKWKNKHCIWDMNEMDFSQLVSGGIRAFIAGTAQISGLREGKKTAIVVASDLGFGMMRMLETLGEEQYQMKVAVFRSLSEAIEWVKS